MIGQQLYDLTPRDEQVTPLEVFNFRQSVATATANIVVTIPIIPKCRILLITHIHAFLSPGSAQNIVNYFVDAKIDSRTDVLALYQAAVAGVGFAPNTADTINYPCYIFVKPGSIISLDASFNTGVAVNTAGLSISGILIPRGNIAI